MSNPIFQRRQLDAIAAVIKSLPDTNRAEVAEVFAQAMARDNGRFKRDLFMRASGAVQVEPAYRVNGSKRTYTLAQAEARRAKIFNSTGNVVTTVEKVDG